MDTLEQVLKVSDDKLHEHAKEMSRRLDACLYLMGLALLAIERSRTYRKYRCVDAVQYAVNHLSLARQKANELLRASRALGKLPLLREAFRTGVVGWGKIREVTRVATAETDQEWLDYARGHSTCEVQGAVTMSPRAYRKAVVAANQPALPEIEKRTSGEGPASELIHSPSPSSNANAPVRRKAHDAPDSPLGPSGPGLQPAAELMSGRGELAAEPLPGRAEPETDLLSGRVELAAELLPARVEPPPARPIPAGRKVRLILDREPAQYARYEWAEERWRQKLGRRLSRVDLFMQMVEQAISTTSTATRGKLPIMVLVDQAGNGWYETRQGPLPATAEEVESALEAAVEILPASEGTLFEPEPAPSAPAGKRTKVPRHLYRALMARSGGKCETPGCGRGAPLHVHHKKPRSKGGKHTLSDCGLFCDICHFRLEHEADFLPGSAWEKARASSQRRRRARTQVQEESARGPGGSRPALPDHGAG